MLGNVEFVPRGCVNGHGELYRTGDAAFIAARGANTSRTGNRWWGTYGQGFQTDSEFDLNPGNINEDYFSDIVAKPIEESYTANQRNLLFMDSNCGQGLQDGDVCKLDGINFADFFTDTQAARTKRQKFIDAGCYIVTQKKGKIDMMELLVEPQGATMTRSALWAFQQEFMDAIMAIDPAMLFVIGGTAYQTNQMANAYNPDWVRSYLHDHIILTGNMLSGLVVNPATRASRLQLFIDARNQWKCPVICQQVGSTIADDPDGSALDDMLTKFDTAAGGPIGYTYWEQLSIFPNSYGFWSLSNSADPLSSRVLNANRLALLQSHFEA